MYQCHVKWCAKCNELKYAIIVCHPPHRWLYYNWVVSQCLSWRFSLATPGNLWPITEQLGIHKAVELLLQTPHAFCLYVWPSLCVAFRGVWAICFCTYLNKVTFCSLKPGRSVGESWCHRSRLFSPVFVQIGGWVQCCRLVRLVFTLIVRHAVFVVLTFALPGA